jgi:hypothetical protein
MSSSRPPTAPPPAAGVRTPSWGTTLVRMFLVLLPSLLIGNGIGGAIYAGMVSPGDYSGGWLVNVVPGVLAGVALGLVLHPGGDRLVGHLAASAAMSVVLLLLLLGLSRLVVPSRVDLDAGALVLGLVITVVVQTVLAGGLWLLRARGRRD